MFYEIRTYDLEPFAVREFMKRYCEALEKRADPGRPVGAWYTDIGPLNQFIQIWAWDSLDVRDDTRAANAKDPHWPPKIREFLTGPMTAEIFIPFGFSPEVKPGTYGPYYEMRIYTMRPGGVPRIAESWPTKLSERTAISPLLLAAYSELGGLQKMVHIWPYESLEARGAAREKAHSTGAWPPSGGDGLFSRMENKIMLPAPCSPVQ